MKKNLFLIAAMLFAFVGGLSAQEDDEFTVDDGGSAGFSYGIKGGLVSSTFASEYQKLSGSNESRTAFSGGLFAEIAFSDMVGLSVEALYVQEGTLRIDPRYVYHYSSYGNSPYSITYTDGTTQKLNNSLVLSKANSNVILHCVEAPVMLNVYLPEMGDARPKIYVGGSYDHILMAQSRDLLVLSRGDSWDATGNIGSDPSSDETYTLPQRSTENVTESFEYFNVSALAGAEFKVGAFSADIRYKVGLKPISNLSTFKFQNYGRQDFSTNTLFVSCGLYLNELF